MSETGILVSIHAFSTLTMSGLIWFVQVVHYPLMRQVGENNFQCYQQEHTRRTTWVVAPLMILEALSAIALIALLDDANGRQAAILGGVLVALIWLSTAALQAPCHRRLSRGLDLRVVNRLVATNWIRTVAWTLRAMIAVMIAS